MHAIRRLSVVASSWAIFCLPVMGQAPADPLKKRPLPPTVAKEVRVLPDLPYAGTDNPRQQLDLYLPAEPASDKLPVIVYIHGGAWRQGDKRTARARLMPFVKSGEYACVSVGYRLSQEAIWPAQIHDCKAAIRWIRGEAATHGLDPERIGVWGSSAGGHLVAMLGVSGGMKDLEGTLGAHVQESSRVTCVANYFGPSRLLTMDDHPGKMTHNAPGSPESQLVGGAIQEHPEQSEQASPFTHVTKDDAPFLHVHGNRDMLVPHNQSVVLDEALDHVGVPSFLITMKDKGHGGFRHPKLDAMLEQFFAVHMRGASGSFEDMTLDPVK